MGFFSDFRTFLLRGNVVDLAVGVIIGAAFGGVTKSMGDDVMMPPIGLAMGAVDFKELYVPLIVKPEARKKYDDLKQALLHEEQLKVAAQNAELAKNDQPRLPIPTDVSEISPTLDEANAKGI